VLLILVFTLIAALAWLSTTGYWDRNGDMFRGYAIALVIIVHLIAFVAALFGWGDYADWLGPQ